jgi:hypothetical protein
MSTITDTYVPRQRSRGIGGERYLPVFNVWCSEGAREYSAWLRDTETGLLERVGSFEDAGGAHRAANALWLLREGVSREAMAKRPEPEQAIFRFPRKHKAANIMPDLTVENVTQLFAAEPSASTDIPLRR